MLRPLIARVQVHSNRIGVELRADQSRKRYCPAAIRSLTTPAAHRRTVRPDPMRLTSAATFN